MTLRTGHWLWIALLAAAVWVGALSWLSIGAYENGSPRPQESGPVQQTPAGPGDDQDMRIRSI